MTTKTLRALAKDYAAGETDYDTYRKARSELIDGILSGTIPVIPIDFPPPLDLEDNDPTVEGEITQINPDPITQRPRPPAPTKTAAPPKTETYHPWMIASGIVALICLVVLIILFTLPNETAEESRPATGQVPVPDATDEKSIETLSEPLSSAATDLIDHFLSRNIWTEKNLQQFLNDWQKMTSAEQSAAMTTPAINQLSNAIHKKLTEERALLGLGDDANVIARQQTLVKFAEQLGINDPRLKVKGEVITPVTDDTNDKALSSMTMGEKTSAPPAIEVVETPVDEKQLETIAMDETISPPPPAMEVVETPVDENQLETITMDETISPPPAVEIAEAPVGEKISEITEPITDTKTTAQEVKEVTGVEETTSDVEPATNKNACRAELAKNRKPYCRDVIDGVGNGPTMVVIRSGKFRMGGNKLHEQPVHDVAIAYPFAMSVREISYGEYQQFCDATQRQCPKQPWAGNDYPIVNVSWNDAIDYTTWLTKKTGNYYRLPSEAEWEYSARAGTKTTYPFGEEVLISDAVFSDRKKLVSPLPNSDRTINRNKFRLYHMVGNVREWVTDTWHENYAGAPGDGSSRDDGGTVRVVRGGSYNDNADALRSGAREKLDAGTSDNFTGFRILQELPE